MAISNLRLAMWWLSFPEWSMVSQLDIMIISMSDTNDQLVVRFTSNLSVVLLLCSSDGPHLNDSLFLILLFLETFVQVITDINDAVSGAVTCEIFESDCIRSCFCWIFLVMVFVSNPLLSQVSDALLFFHGKGLTDFENFAWDDFSSDLWWMTDYKIPWIMMLL